MKDNMSSVYSFADNAEMGDGNIKAGGGKSTTPKRRKFWVDLIRLEPKNPKQSHHPRGSIVYFINKHARTYNGAQKPMRALTAQKHKPKEKRASVRSVLPSLYPEPQVSKLDALSNPLNQSL